MLHFLLMTMEWYDMHLAMHLILRIRVMPQKVKILVSVAHPNKKKTNS